MTYSNHIPPFHGGVRNEETADNTQILSCHKSLKKIKSILTAQQKLICIEFAAQNKKKILFVLDSCEVRKNV